jgi:predicted DNA-binding protein (MmcQ/YjbR family)
MAKIDDPLLKMREICLSLPDTQETMTWGAPHFRVGDKIFSGYGAENGKGSISFKLEMDHADARVQDPRFQRAPYVGHKGWVSMDPFKVQDWDEVRSLVLESYRLIAPKKSLAKLSEAMIAGPAAMKPTPSRPAAKKPTPSKPAAKKPTPSKPAVKKSAAKKPPPSKPAAKKAAASKPAAKKPSAKKPR